jgi:hypothetical protein
LQELKLGYICHPITYKGLTGFDSRCKDWARMSGGVCTPVNNSYELYLANLITPWLHNLSLTGQR